MDVEAIAASVGYRFSNEALLRQALTHRSFGASHNERLEFLGDSVLNCVIASELFGRFPEMAEGELSRARAALVNQQSLHAVALRIGLGSHLMLGDGELRSGGNQRPSILADCVEALIGAAFLDRGYAAAHDLVARLLAPELASAEPGNFSKDAKTLLQEFLQARRIALPRYVVVDTSGGAHEQLFRVECGIDQLRVRTQGEGASRRAAEQMAAQRAYELVSVDAR